MADYKAHRPVLRNDCGLQLQRAWQDGLWANVISHAKTKAKATKDPYFEVSPNSLYCSSPANMDSFTLARYARAFRRLCSAQEDSVLVDEALRISGLEAEQSRHSSEASHPTHLSNTLPREIPSPYSSRMGFKTENLAWEIYGVSVMICLLGEPRGSFFYAKGFC